jgi:serine/threonine protein kinase
MGTTATKATESKCFLDESKNMKSKYDLSSEGGGRSMRDIIDRTTKSGISVMDFTLLTTVGKGNFGKVYQVKKIDNNKVYAMKVLNKERAIGGTKNYERTISERKIVAALDHPFLARLRYAFQSGTKLFMIFDFFNGGELYHYLSKGRFTEDCAKFYTAEIALGIAHLHSNGIVYRDLKPENLLLDEGGHIRITDFGLSKLDVDETASVRSICGTPEYLAPEIINKQPYGKGVDWWSLGTLLYEMLAGLPPFYDKNRQRMYHKIIRAELVRPPFMSAVAFDLCSKLLERNPEKRYGANGTDEIRDHAFFKCINWNKLLKKEVVPPFIPRVKDSLDISNIDPAFTRELPTVTPTPVDAVLVDDEAFRGFTFDENEVGGGEIDLDITIGYEK